MTDKLEVLNKVFGYSSFRSCQGEIIDAVTAGQDVLAVMPTGAGKSLCYQIPAIMLEGTAIVVSPLISLMKDQLDKLRSLGIRAAAINSSLTPRQRHENLAELSAGRLDLVYVSPEGLDNNGFLDAIRGVRVSLLVVDEAHCVSQWGHDFRPKYREINEFAKILSPRPVIAAFTATATEKTGEDIIRALQMTCPVVFKTGYERSNLLLSVRPLSGDVQAEKTQFILDYLRSHPEDCGIIYCSTKDGANEVYRFLLGKGFPVGLYHADVEGKERDEAQSAFLSGKYRIMVATTAFGMGIDKPDIRFVIHHAVPGSMEAYYQEAGRAGRDGKPSECILLYSGKDLLTQNRLYNSREYKDLAADEIGFLISEDRQRLSLMKQYCETDNCLWQYINHYFGEHNTARCGSCSSCKGSRKTVEAGEEAEKTHSAAPAVPPELLSRLKAVRREYARTNRLKSDFLPDKVLKEIILLRPANAEELSSSGLIPAKYTALCGPLFEEIGKGCGQTSP